MRIEIITIGDEVLRDETCENNASYLSRELASAGLELSRIAVLPDDQGIIAEELQLAIERSNVVIVTGGLGPTVDDVTRQAAIEALGGEVEIREDVVEEITVRFDSLGLDMPHGYKDLARVPSGARILKNDVGAAPGLAVKSGECELFLLPGVPAEMHSIFQVSVLPALSVFGLEKKFVIDVFGMMETSVEDKISEIIDDEMIKEISIIAGPTGIRLYLPKRFFVGDGRGLTRDNVHVDEPGILPGNVSIDRLGTPSEPGADNMINRLREALGSYIFSFTSEKMEKVVLDLLRESGSTLSVAESVTGGLLASTLVSVPGASDSFMEGFVTYSNESKVNRLGVNAGLIEEYGAVSRETCIAMVRGVRKKAGTDIGLSTTGIAGPGGATGQKAVGLCYIGLATQDVIYCRKMQFPGDRYMVRLRTVYVALDMLRLMLTGNMERLRAYIVKKEG